MEIKVKDIDGNVYTSDTLSGSDKTILAIYFCTSCTQCKVQERVFEDGVESFVCRDVIVPTKNDYVFAQGVDFVAVKDDEWGEFV